MFEDRSIVFDENSNNNVFVLIYLISRSSFLIDSDEISRWDFSALHEQIALSMYD